jgi:hypothetical protein
MHRRFLAAVAVVSLALAIPVFADENPRGTPGLRDRAVKVMKLIAHLLEGGDLSWPHP